MFVSQVLKISFSREKVHLPI